MPPAVDGANETLPATARYGVVLSDTFWFAFGVVMVTEVVAAPASPATATATAAVSATISAFAFTLSLLCPRATNRANWNQGFSLPKGKRKEHENLHQKIPVRD